MSEEPAEQPTEEPIEAPVEEPVNLAPGRALALAPQEEQEGDARRRRGPDPLAALRAWEPRTRLGRMVASGEIYTYEQALDTGLPVREVEIVDALLPDLTDDVLSVNMIQRMTDSGRRVRFNVLCAVGNGDGYVGLSVCKGKEVASTIRKAIDKAKLNLVPVMRGKGSFGGAWDQRPVHGDRGLGLDQSHTDARTRGQGTCHWGLRPQGPSPSRHHRRMVALGRTDPDHNQLRSRHLQCAGRAQPDSNHRGRPH